MSTLPAVRPNLATPDGALVFEFPLPMNRANRHQHFMAKHKARKELWRVLDQRVTVKYLPKPPAKPYDRAHAVMEVRTFRQMDEDNATARTKDCLDWLVTRGYVVDDSPLHLSLSVRATTAPRHEVGITLTLREVA